MTTITLNDATTFEEAKRVSVLLYQKYTEASAALQVFPSGPNGLTPDAVKFSPEFRAAKAHFDSLHRELRKFNGWYTKKFKKELREERSNRYKKAGE